MKSPTPEQVLKARQRAKLTQTAAADVVHVNLLTWQRWEGGAGGERRAMHPAFWELFTIKVRDLREARRVKRMRSHLKRGATLGEAAELAKAS